MIYVEPREPHIVVVTRGGFATREDQNTHQGQPEVRTATQKKYPLYVQKEKGFFLEVRPKFVDANQLSTSGQVKTMPE